MIKKLKCVGAESVLAPSLIIAALRIRFSPSVRESVCHRALLMLMWRRISITDLYVSGGYVQRAPNQSPPLHLAIRVESVA